MTLSEQIESQSPRGWKEFITFSSGLISSLPEKNIHKYPFEMQVGLFLEFFQEESIYFDWAEYDTDILKKSISDAFDGYERTFDHFS